MANMRYTSDDSVKTMAGTYADVGEPDERGSSQIRRRPTQATRQFPVDEVLDDVDEAYNTEEMPPVRRVSRKGSSSMIGPDYARRPFYRHSTYTDHEIDQNRVEAKPSRQNQKAHHAGSKILFYAGVALTIAVSGVFIWTAGVEPVIEHWHTGDSPVRSYVIKVNNKLCDVQASYLSNNKVVVVVTPQDINASPQVFEMTVKSNAPGPHVVTIQSSYDSNGNPDMQTYIDGVEGPAIVNTSHGPKMR